MSRVSLTPLAIHDLDDVWDYIRQDNKEAATRTVQAIHEQCVALSVSPRMGRDRAADLGRGIRSFPMGSYVIFYRIAQAHILVLRILHSARDISDLID